MAGILAWLGSRVGHLVFYVVVLGIGLWIAYAGLIRPVIHPNPSSTQSGGVSYNYTIHLGMLSCARIPKPQEQVANVVKPIVDKVKGTIK